MNALDILLILIVLASTYMGWRRGFAFSLLDLVRWVGSLVLSFRLYPSLADWLSRATDWNDVWWETCTWGAGLPAITERIQVFATVHVPTVHPVRAAKEAVRSSTKRNYMRMDGPLPTVLIRER